MSVEQSLADHAVVSQQEWIEARRQLLSQEKELTRHQDRIAVERRKLPWLKVDKQYFFETDAGQVSLADLFGEHSQLIVQHYMLSSGRDICTGCSFAMDHIESALVHLPHGDVSFVAVSRAPVEQIRAAQRRMGWSARWVSSLHSNFNYDFHVSFTPEQVARGEVFYNYEMMSVPVRDLPGYSVFYKDRAGKIYLTYTAFARGQENILTTYVLLDMTPKGRNESGADGAGWVRPHDRYDTNGFVDPTGQFIAGGRVTEAKTCCRGP